MKSTTNIMTLENHECDPVVNRFLQVMGSKVKAIVEDWGDGDISTDYSFPDRGDQTVAWGGDDAIGAITGAYMEDGKLIAIFNFGDEGDFKVHIHENQDALYVLDDL